MNMTVGKLLRLITGITLFLTAGTVPIGCAYAYSIAPPWLAVEPSGVGTPAIFVAAATVLGVLVFLAMVVLSGVEVTKPATPPRTEVPSESRSHY